jgi:hypothetical protein
MARQMLKNLFSGQIWDGLFESVVLGTCPNPGRLSKAPISTIVTPATLVSPSNRLLAEVARPRAVAI